MTNFLILRVKALAFRADPEVQAARVAAELPSLTLPTLGDGETWQDPKAAAAPDIEAPGARGSALVHLDQLALDHLYGVR